MRRLFTVSLLVMAGVGLMAGPALALRSGVQNHLSIKDKTVHSDDTIVLNGKLSSSRVKCIKNRTVTLFIDGAQYGTTKSNDNGGYQFKVHGPHPLGDHAFYTTTGKTQRCKSSMSNTVHGTVSE